MQKKEQCLIPTTDELVGAQSSLPDLFSRELQIELAQGVEESLRRVGERQAIFGGLKMNWTGGYDHAARAWLEYIELRAERRKGRQWQTR